MFMDLSLIARRHLPPCGFPCDGLLSNCLNRFFVHSRMYLNCLNRGVMCYRSGHSTTICSDLKLINFQIAPQQVDFYVGEYIVVICLFLLILIASHCK